MPITGCEVTFGEALHLCCFKRVRQVDSQRGTVSNQNVPLPRLWNPIKAKCIGQLLAALNQHETMFIEFRWHVCRKSGVGNLHVKTQAAYRTGKHRTVAV